MSTIEKVNLWLPLASTKGREIQVNIDDAKKAALLAKLSEIDQNEEETVEPKNRFRISQVDDSSFEYNNNAVPNDAVEKKANLMAELFGTSVAAPGLISYDGKPLKTSLKKSPSVLSKTVTFYEEQLLASNQ